MNFRSRKHWLIMLISILMLFGIALLSVKQKSFDYKSQMPKDFNFVANYYGGAYILDTYHQKLTVALDWNKDTVLPFRLTNEEKKHIYDVMCDIDIYQYPQDYGPTSKVIVDPSPDFNLKFTLDTVTCTINWEENTWSETRAARNLRKLFEQFSEIIEKDKRVQALPKSRRAVL